MYPTSRGRRKWRAASVCAGAILLGIAAGVATAGEWPGGLSGSYAAGARDVAGRFMGGTEIRNLAAFQGRLYAGNGYWMDRPGEEGPQGAQILVLDAAAGRWRVEHQFDEKTRNGRPRLFAMSALLGVTFTTDGSGVALREPVSLLLAASWDVTGRTEVHSRDVNGAWIAMHLADDRPAPDFLPQIRSLAFHRDRSGIDRVFAGQDPRGIFSGVYDPSSPGAIRWSASPELDISTLPTESFPGLGRRLRVSSFAVCGDALYAAVGQHIFRREEEVSPRWRVLYTNPRPGFSETGLRGLTCTRMQSGACCSPRSKAGSRASYGSIRATAARPRSSICRRFWRQSGRRSQATSSPPTTT